MLAIVKLRKGDWAWFARLIRGVLRPEDGDGFLKWKSDTGVAEK